MALTPETVERNLVSSIKSMADVSLVVDRGITPESFLIYGPVFEFLTEYLKTYNDHAPTNKDIEQKFVGTEAEIVLDQPGELPFYVDELARQILVREMSSAVRERFGPGGELLTADPEDVLALLGEDLRKLGHTQTANNVAFFDRDAMDRLQLLKDRIEMAEKGEVIGIPTGLKVFDESLQGWQPGEAIMVIGPTTIGKSWLLMKFACEAYVNGCKVLFLSPEMSWEECAMRFDVVLGHMYEQQLTHTGLTTGTLVNLTKYQSWLQHLSGREDFICIDSVDAAGFTLNGVIAAAEEYAPDLLLVDGIDRVSLPESGPGWEIIKAVANGLKDYAQWSKSVVIWTGQVDREGMKQTEAVSSMANTAYGKAAVEYANRVISLGPDASNPLRRTFKVPKNRSGQAYNVRQYLTFNVNEGHIEQTKVTVSGDFDSENMIEI